MTETMTAKRDSCSCDKSQNKNSSVFPATSQQQQQQHQNQQLHPHKNENELQLQLQFQKREKSRSFTIFSLCALWLAVSSCNSIVGKILLKEFPFPVSVTFAKLCSIACYSIPLLHFIRRPRIGSGAEENSGRNLERSINLASFRLRAFGFHGNQNRNQNRIFMTVVLISLGQVLVSVTSHVSISKVAVSYCQTVKGLMPLFTVFLERLIFNERHLPLVYLSLVPIVVGVSVATATELEFDTTGLLMALVATASQSTVNIYSKKVMKETKAHSLELLAFLGRYSTLLFFPVWILLDFSKFWNWTSNLEWNFDHEPRITAETDSDWFLSGSVSRISLLLWLDGVLNFLQNVLVYAVLSLVTPLTHSIVGTSKRITVIAVSIVILGNPVTPVNIFGMALAILGILIYTQAKQSQKPGGKADSFKKSSSDLKRVKPK